MIDPLSVFPAQGAAVPAPSPPATAEATSAPAGGPLAKGFRVVGRVLLLAIALFASWWILHLTSHGLGVGSDSTVYFAGAESLAEGRGFVWLAGDGLPRPINHYPPFYSAVLSIGLRLLPTPEDVARILEVLLMGANVLLIAALIGLLTSSRAAAILGALLFMASEETLTIHSYAMSDGLYLFLVLVCVTASTHYWRRGGTQLNRLLMWGSAGLAFLTRYVGVSLFVVPLVVTLARPPRPSSRKRETFVGFALAALPGLLWLIRNGVLTGSMTNRRPGFFPQDLSWWQQFGRLAESWFVPGRIVHLFETAHIPPGVLLVVGLLIGVGLIVLHRGRGKRSPTQPRSWLPLAAFLAAHLGTIALSSWFSYPGPDIDTRTLAPVFVGSLVLVAAILGSGCARGSRRARVALALAAVAFLGFKVYASRDVVTRLLSDGQGYTSDAWSRSATVAALQRLNPEVVYANDIGAVYYFTGRFANIIPLRYDPITLREREAYPAEYCRMRRRLREVDGVVVYFARTPLPEEAEPGAITKGLESIHNGADGGLYADGGGPVAECEISRRSSPDTEGTSGEGRSDEALSDLSSMAVVEGAPTATGDGVAEGYPVERLERVSMGAGRFES